MCGIIGVVSEKDVVKPLMCGLKYLEYRGYDSAGLVVINSNQRFQSRRVLGKVNKLDELIIKKPVSGHIGIAHTRWATHGKPSQRNAHPHIASNEIALVHNGIIENNEALRAQLLAQGVIPKSETDSELIAHLVYGFIQSGQDFLSAVRTTVAELEGTFSVGLIYRREPGRLLAVRSGSPLIIGLGDKENFIASDKMAFSSHVTEFIYLEEGDIADVHSDDIKVYDQNGIIVIRPIHRFELNHEMPDKGQYAHFMLKEIFEQPDTLVSILEGRITEDHLVVETFGSKAAEIFPQIKRVLIVACGTSYHAGLVGRYWLEEIAGLSCQVEIASENRYRVSVIEPDTLFVTISQSGETADTLAALRQAKKSGYAATLSICNVEESTLSRESDLLFMTRAGPEIGVASTKSFTSQLVALFLLTIALGRAHLISANQEAHLIKRLKHLPTQIKQALQLDASIQAIANTIIHADHILFLGRNIEFPIALEAALKLKEISYIHAEAYPAGELKHGSLALVDSDMWVIALAPTKALLNKLKSNLEEVLARSAKLIVFTDIDSGIQQGLQTQVLTMPITHKFLSPIVYTIPMQLLAYHVGNLKGIDVDQPRNLAKSVTVE